MGCGDHGHPRVPEPVEHCARQGDAFLGVGAGAQFVDQHQGTVGCGVHDGGQVLHVRREGGQGCGDRLLVADVGVDAAVDRQGRVGSGRYLQACLIHQTQQSDRLQTDGLAARVGPGDDHDARIGSHREVQRHRGVAQLGMARPLQGQGADLRCGARVSPRIAGPRLYAVESGRDRHRALQVEPLERYLAGQLAQHAPHLRRVPVAGGHHGVVGLYIAQRFDVEGGAARRHLVHHARHARTVAGLQRHHGAPAALGGHRAVEAAAQRRIGHQLAGRRFDLQLQAAQVALHPRKLRDRMILNRPVDAHHAAQVRAQRSQQRQLGGLRAQRRALDRIGDLRKRAADRLRRGGKPPDGRQLLGVERRRATPQAAERRADLRQIQLGRMEAGLQQAPQLHRRRPFGQHRRRIGVYAAGQHLPPSRLPSAVLRDLREHARQAEQRRRTGLGRRVAGGGRRFGHACARSRSRSRTSRSRRR